MIRLVEGMENTIKVYVASSIVTTGFSAKFLLPNVEKEITSISDGRTYSITFSVEEVESLSTPNCFGSYIILNEEGETYQTGYIEVQKVSEEEAYKAIDFREIFISIVANWFGEDSGGGGGDMSKYATKVQLAQTSESDRHYTDEKVSDVIVDALENQTVTVLDEHGEPVQITVKQSMQTTEDLRGAVENLSETRLQGKVIDEEDPPGPDDDTLYLFTQKMRGNKPNRIS